MTSRYKYKSAMKLLSIYFCIFSRLIQHNYFLKISKYFEYICIFIDKLFFVYLNFCDYVSGMLHKVRIERAYCFCIFRNYWVQKQNKKQRTKSLAVYIHSVMCVYFRVRRIHDFFWPGPARLIFFRIRTRTRFIRIFGFESNWLITCGFGHESHV
jgi:hypothetical protein